MYMTRNKKSISLALGLMVALIGTSVNAEVQQEPALAAEVHNNGISIAIEKFEKALHDFFWGSHHWADTVDKLLATFNEYKDAISAKIGHAKAVALAAALGSVKYPGKGKAGLLKVKDVLNQFEEELIALASATYNKVKGMGDMQLYVKVGHKVKAA